MNIHNNSYNNRYSNLMNNRSASQRFINTYGRRNYVFDYNGETYYYKKNKRIDSCYKELIATELLKKLNLPYVEYDLACNGEEIGVISKSFLKKGEKIIYIEDILIPGEQDIVRTSLEGIWNSLEIEMKII